MLLKKGKNRLRFISGAILIFTLGINHCANFNEQPSTGLLITLGILADLENARLSNITPSAGTLSPAFSSEVTDYSVDLSIVSATLSLAPITAVAGAKVKVNGVTVESGAESQALTMSLGNTDIQLQVIAPNGETTKTYNIHANRTLPTQEAYLKASNPGASDSLGQWRTLALDGDTMVVGSPYEDSNASGVNGNQNDNSSADSGAVYVFVRSNGEWTQQAYLKASTNGAGDRFGLSVALQGDTLVVGAPYENTSGLDSGAAYVFTRTNGVWSQQAYLKASNVEADDYFGFTVAVYEDTIAVGAFQEDSSATGVDGAQGNGSSDSGAVYVFSRSGGAWSQQAYIKSSNPDTFDYFGRSLALHENTLIVGAPREDSSTTGVGGNQADNGAGASGAAYVFFRSGVTWSQQAYLKASNTGAGDNFGDSVTVYGDTLAIGAKYEASTATGINGVQTDGAGDAGAVYVFSRSGSSWGQQAYIKASNSNGSDRFGTSIALHGDTLVVGADGESSSATGVNGDQTDNSLPESGAAYVFTRLNSTWAQEAYLKTTGPEISDYFGTVVAVTDGLIAAGGDGEDSSTGADQSDNGAFGSGAIYIFR